MNLDDFAGEWRIDRQIEDRLGNRVGTLSGKAEFTAIGLGMRYAESGTVNYPGQPPMTARQTYLWHLDGQGVAVCFADGRAFHRIELGIPQWRDVHDCPPDLYRVRYDFAAWPNWETFWHVRGPRKDYTMTTRYARGSA